MLFFYVYLRCLTFYYSQTHIFSLFKFLHYFFILISHSFWPFFFFCLFFLIFALFSFLLFFQSQIFSLIIFSQSVNIFISRSCRSKFSIICVNLFFLIFLLAGYSLFNCSHLDSVIIIIFPLVCLKTSLWLVWNFHLFFFNQLF